jgi:hypothetical protein
MREPIARIENRQPRSESSTHRAAASQRLYRRTSSSPSGSHLLSVACLGCFVPRSLPEGDLNSNRYVAPEDVSTTPNHSFTSSAISVPTATSACVRAFDPIRQGIKQHLIPPSTLG